MIIDPKVPRGDGLPYIEATPVNYGTLDGPTMTEERFRFHPPTNGNVKTMPYPGFYPITVEQEDGIPVETPDETLVLNGVTLTPGYIVRPDEVLFSSFVCPALGVLPLDGETTPRVFLDPGNYVAYVNTEDDIVEIEDEGWVPDPMFVSYRFKVATFTVTITDTGRTRLSDIVHLISNDIVLWDNSGGGGGGGSGSGSDLGAEITITQLGSGAEVFADDVGPNFRVRTLVSNTSGSDPVHLTITETAETLEFDTTYTPPDIGDLLPSASTGDILYYDSPDWVVLPRPATGGLHVLACTSTGLPYWEQTHACDEE